MDAVVSGVLADPLLTRGRVVRQETLSSDRAHAST
jgi:hypothetical protein